MKEEGRDLEIGGSCSVRGETNRGSDVSCEVVRLLAASGFYGAEKDDVNNPFSVLVTYSPEGGAVLDASFVTAHVSPLCLQGVIECYIL